ncbi:thioredoxin family protein [Aerococcaceae bacterium DSM 111020]|nr:thioredoxin family protein [Aerococcaceae bacterium DSM 111020]
MEKNFDEIVQNFIPVLAKEADQKLENEKGTIVFIGRPTCPYCRKFVQTLDKAYAEKELVIHYVNSEHPEDANDLKTFRDKYDIPTVPGLLYSNGDTVQSRCDSSMSLEEVYSFVEAD